MKKNDIKVDQKDIEKYKKQLVVNKKNKLVTFLVVGAVLVVAGGLTAGHFGYKATHPAPAVVPEKFVVTFETNGGSAIEPVQVEKGKYLAKPSDPKRDGHVFTGWYSDKKLEYKFDFENTPIMSNLTLYANWNVPITEDGISYERNADGKSLAVYAAIPSKLTPNINIPETHEDPESKVIMPVTAVKANGFYECKNIQNIQLPKTIEIIDEYAFYSCTALENIAIPDGTRVINKGAFYGCTSLQRVVFSANSKLIEINGDAEYGAFAYCIKLNDVILPSTLLKIDSGSFTHCTNLAKIDLNKGLMNIGDNSFNGCANLEGVVIPASTVRIDENAFYGCKCDSFKCEDDISGWQNSEREVISNFNEELANGTKLYKKEFVDSENKFSLCYIGKDADNETLLCSIADINNQFTGDLVIPAKIKSGNYEFKVVRIAEYGFGKDSGESTKISSVSIPASVKTIGAYAFANTEINTVDFPDGSSLISIGDFAFKSCHKLVKFSTPDSLEEIGNGAFYLSGLVNLDISAKVINIKPTIINNVSYAPFHGCTYLEIINVSEDNPYYATKDDLLYSKNETKLVSLIKCPENYQKKEDIVLENEIVYIEPAAFYNVNHIKTVKIPDSVEIIGNKAFYFGESRQNYISNIEITNSSKLSYIGDEAFTRCTLTNINLPLNLLGIGSRAFYYCSKLKNISIPSKVTYIGSELLFGCGQIYSASNIKFLDETSSWSIYSAKDYSLKESQFIPSKASSSDVTRYIKEGYIWWKNN